MSHKFIPLREIDFAVKVGFLTKTIWTEFFAHDYGGQRWKDKLWQKFVKDGFFVAAEGLTHICFPNPNHSTVKDSAPFIARPPSLNQLAHDELVARTYLLLARAFPSAEIKTEAWLRKESPFANKGRRTSEQQKHPDLAIKMGGRRLALEIELTQKSRTRYRASLRTYRSSGYARVVYVIRNEATMTAIERAAAEVSFPREEISLGFASIGDWRNNPIATRIHFENKTQTLAEIFG